MTQVGFWRQSQTENRVATLNDYGQINKVWYLFPQGGGPRGSFTTFSDLKGNLRSRDLIYLSGVLREQAVTPDDVFDVTILGAANTPRQATSGGTPTGGGASWIAPASPTATTPLLEIVRSGWSIQNIEMTPHTSSAAIRLTRSATVDAIDASHAFFAGLYICGQGGSGQIGIEDNGGSSRVFILDSRFELLTGTAILSLNTAAAIPLGWQIGQQDAGNRFQQNTNDIKMSLSYSRIQNNGFMTAGSGSTNKVISTTFISTQGGNNHILLNQFTNTEAGIAPGSGFTGAASDVWMNYVTDQAALAFGQPA